MLKKIKPMKIYFIFILLLIISSLIYGILIKKEMVKTDSSSISKYSFLIGISMFFILGFMGGNNKQKRGLITGFLYGFFVIALLFLVRFLGFDNLNKAIISKSLIYLLASSLGGIIGVNLKKII